MTAGVRIAHSQVEFNRCLACVEAVIDTNIRLPESPFKSETGFTSIIEFTRIQGNFFVPVFTALITAFGDSEVDLVTLDPSPSYYSQNYSYFASVSFDADSISRYWDGISYEPGGDPAGGIAFTADVIAIAGSSGRWAIWGSHSWGVAIVWSEHNGWRRDVADVPFVSADEAVDFYLKPDPEYTLRTEAELAKFLQNFGSVSG